MRSRIVAGNWKMNTTRESARKLAQAIVAGLPSDSRVQVVLCPPNVYLGDVAQIVAGSRVALGAQNCHYRTQGAYTGEVSPAMLVDVGCTHVILGHSERRHGLDENDAVINFKVQAALDAGLNVILCVGESREERKDRRMEQVLYRQVAAGLAGIEPKLLDRLVIAYEPVWAIGTGDMATPEQAEEAHAFIRAQIASSFGSDLAARLPILYGGSAKAENVATLIGQPDIDGGLIGGASLAATDFLSIVRLANPA